MYRISRNLPAELALRLNGLKLDTLTPLSDPFRTMNDLEFNALRQEVAALRREVSQLRDEADIRYLQYRYGFYDEQFQWDRLLDLFADEDCSVEIGARGKYIGKPNVMRFYREVIAHNRTKLMKNEIYNHLQLQMVITVDADGLHAKARSRALIQGARNQVTSLLLAEGVYENSYVKQNGIWKIQHMYWAPTFYADIPVKETIRFAGVTESTTVAPDVPARAPDPDIGRVIVPIHF